MKDIEAGRPRYPEILSHADPLTAANLSAVSSSSIT